MSPTLAEGFLAPESQEKPCVSSVSPWFPHLNEEDEGLPFLWISQEDYREECLSVMPAIQKTPHISLIFDVIIFPVFGICDSIHSKSFNFCALFNIVEGAQHGKLLFSGGSISKGRMFFIAKVLA